MYVLCRTCVILLILITSHIVNHFSLTLNLSLKNLMKIFSLESQVTSECTVVSAANMRSNWCSCPIACGPDSCSRTAQDVLAAVQQTMQDSGTNSIKCVGHSLGMSFEMLVIRFKCLKLLLRCSSFGPWSHFPSNPHLWCRYWDNQLWIASRKVMSSPRKAGLASLTTECYRSETKHLQTSLMPTWKLLA